MTDQLHCTRGCRRRGRHLADCEDQETCHGCQPRETEHGVLCRTCGQKLERLLGDPDDHESIAGACVWLATNLGQYIRTPSGGTRGSAAGEHFVIVAAAMSALQVSLVEFALDFADDRSMKPPPGTEPAKVAAWLRPWSATLAAWEPIADTLDHLLDLMADAHSAAPWRGRDPEASDQAAAMLYRAPAEPTQSVCDRFGIKPTELLYWRKRKRIDPVDPSEKPLRWTPWSVFSELHPEAARRFNEQLEAVTRADVMWTA